MSNFGQMPMQPMPQQMQYNPYQQVPDWMQERFNQLNQRVTNKPQQYGQYQAQPTQTPITAAPVTSLEEARAYPISFDDRLFVLVNGGANEVYVKRFNRNTGGANFVTYKPEQSTPQEAPDEALTASNPAWATAAILHAGSS